AMPSPMVRISRTSTPRSRRARMRNGAFWSDTLPESTSAPMMTMPAVVRCSLMARVPPAYASTHELAAMSISTSCSVLQPVAPQRHLVDAYRADVDDTSRHRIELQTPGARERCRPVGAKGGVD